MIRFLLFLLISTGILCAQDMREFYDLYEEKDFNGLKNAVEKHGSVLESNYEYQFFKAIFINDGEQAIKIYKNLFNAAGAKLKPLVAKKLFDYYYAKGYYITAKKYEDILVHSDTKEQTVEVKAGQTAGVNLDKSKFYIQLGAFSSKNNAKRLQNELSGQKIYTDIVQRTFNNQLFYCVWLAGYESYATTLKYAEKIKKTISMDYHIVQP